MFENKKNKLIIYLTGYFELKKDELSTINIEFGDMGFVKSVDVEGIEREFIEQREIYIKEKGFNIGAFGEEH